MTIHFTARHFKASEELQQLTENSVKLLADRYDGIVSVDVILDRQNHGSNQEVAEISVSVYRDTLFAKEGTMNFEKSVHACIEKLERQLIRYKERLQGGRNSHALPEVSSEEE